MTDAELPPVPAWIRWLAEAPAVFEAVPEGFSGGVVRVRAVVADLFAHHGHRADAALLAAFDPADTSAGERDRLRAVLLACRVLHHPALRGLPAPAMRPLLVTEMAAWAATVGANVTSDERREELARRCLRAAGLRPGGESAAEAEDRFAQVDAIARARVLRDAAEREKRARAVREAMARAAAEEAAAKVSRE